MYAPASEYPLQGDGYKFYGTESIASRKLVKRKSNLVSLCGSLLLPLLIFALVFALRSFKVRYDNPSGAFYLCLMVFILPLAFAVMACSALSRSESSGGDPRILCFVFFGSLLSWVIAYIAGDMNYQFNMQPFYDITQLNIYSSVDPALYRGNQLMDAGQITFTKGSHIDQSKSAGFMNKDTYCVAPIVSGNSNATNATNATTATMETYDFWAVGINCCSAHIADFHCGEWDSPDANHGLRLLRDDEREYFRLAVEMAKSSFNIKADHPLFMYWMVAPKTEINAYQDKGFEEFMLACSLFFSWQLIVTVLMGILLSKI